MDILGNFSKLRGDKHRRHISSKKDVEFSYSDIAFDPLSKIENRTATFSMITLRTSMIFLFCLLLSRLFFIQIVNGDKNQALAEGNRIRPRVIESSRGIITDSNGDWLARNTPDFALAIYPSDLPKKKAERTVVYEKLADLSGLSIDEITKEAEENGLLTLDMVVLKDHLSHDDALIMEKKVSGIQGAVVAKKYSREYALLPGISHIVGYTGKISAKELAANPTYLLSDKIGKMGIESQYENELKGKNGVEQIEVDSKGNIVRVMVEDGQQNPVAGENIGLYIDRGLQQKTADALKAGIEQARINLPENNVNAGVAIVMDVNTGGILSMVSLPDYDANLFANGITNEDYQKLLNDDSRPLLNRAITGTYPPGSVVKIIMAAAGLAEKVITKQLSFDTPAQIQIGSYNFPDWKDHGVTNIVRAIAESNNIFFYSIGGGYDKIKGIGIDLINKYWKLFGLGAKTGIDIPGESSGLLPTPEWKKKVTGESWYIGDTYHVSIGQGDLLVTPLQMLRATTAVANGGKLLQPQLVKKISTSSGTVVKEFGPIVQNDNLVSADIIKTVQEGMRMTVTDGSARSLNDLPFTSAGKTGTAQFLNNQKTHAWFECYAPYENPEIAVLVMIEGGGGGNEVSVPVAREIMKYYFENK